MKVVSTNIGEKKSVPFKGKMVETGIFKFPVSEIFLGNELVENDAIINRKYHGGIEQAVYAYSYNHYEYWKNLYPDLNWNYGMFGENLTVSNLEESEICKGNIYRLGDAVIEVTKPRTPCVKLGIRFKTQQILKQFWNSSKCGIYFKVLQNGKVSLGDELILIKKKENAPTIAEMYKAKKP